MNAWRESDKSNAIIKLYSILAVGFLPLILTQRSNGEDGPYIRTLTAPELVTEMHHPVPIYLVDIFNEGNCKLLNNQDLVKVDFEALGFHARGGRPGCGH